MYTEKRIGPWDYEELASCPYCKGRGLNSLDSDNCPHFVVAFQYGLWVPTLCPPVWCNGFLFARDALKDDARKVSSNAVDVVCLVKPGTPHHPRIEAFFCADTRIARELVAKHRKTPLIRPGSNCPECGQLATVIGEGGDLVCALCGASCGAYDESPASPATLWIN